MHIFFTRKSISYFVSIFLNLFEAIPKELADGAEEKKGEKEAERIGTDSVDDKSGESFNLQRSRTTSALWKNGALGASDCRLRAVSTGCSPRG